MSVNSCDGMGIVDTRLDYDINEIRENVNIGSDNLIWSPCVHSEQHVVH
jgi:hypothetical protein